MVASSHIAAAAVVALLASLLGPKFAWATSSSSLAISDGDVASRRELLFTTRVDHCRKVSGNLYQTVSVRSILSRRAQRRRGDVPGKCGAVCAETCNHQPCRDDFLAINNNTCECNTAAVSRCGQGATCTVLVPGQNETCTCPAGFQLNVTGGNCVDINECSANRNLCARNLTCVNTEGSYTCDCPRGYTSFAPDPASNETTCVDIDECVATPGVCPSSECVNTVGSFRCGRCLPGYRGNPPAVPCTDINECVVNAGVCGNGNCTNTVGSYTCDCRAGYQFVNATTCLDRDECAEGIASCDASVSRCRNTEGSFQCRCLPGFRGNPPTTPCTDINECALNATLCLPIGLCENTQGSYECACTVGYTFTNGTCVDRDECVEDPNICDLSVSRCRNIDGGYVCRCIDGFNSTSDGKCVQIFKFQAYQPCVETFDCANGLECAVKSRSETTSKVCCDAVNVSPCLGNQRCCAGAYTEGQRCPSKADVDCRAGLECGWRGILDTTFVCCDRTVPVLGGNKVCRL